MLNLKELSFFHFPTLDFEGESDQSNPFLNQVLLSKIQHFFIGCETELKSK